MSEVITIGEPLVLFGAAGSAETDKELSEVEYFQRFLAGAEINVCIGLSRLGHSAEYITKLGNDPFGAFVLKSLNDESVGTSYITSTGDYFTGFQIKSKVSTGDPKIFYFRKNSAASHFDGKDLEGLNWENVKYIHLSGIFPALSENTRKAFYSLIDLAKAKHVGTVFDPNLRPQLWKSQTEMIATINDIAFKSDMVMPGIEEGFILTGSKNADKIADFYLERGVKLVIVKLGEKGAFVKNRNESYTVKGFKVDKIVDTVGAGDGFAAGVISGLLEGLSVKDSVVRGNAIGALAIMSPGDNDGYPTSRQLKEFMELHRTEQ
ncbi:sugar kinase [Caproiciproducens sp.]|uniref:sugar kinase n=1 Tax=Caproiciproducens sp. TaxID=1954376 RepID=UPI002899AA20|nr:sugar kinase [Caproiciproducens sp.]